MSNHYLITQDGTLWEGNDDYGYFAFDHDHLESVINQGRDLIEIKYGPAEEVPAGLAVRLERLEDAIDALRDRG